MNLDTVRESAPAKRYKLLFADDHQLILDALTRIAGSQYDVTVVATAQEFEDAARTSQPDLAILDISMPGGDGFEAARRARLHNPTLKLMFLSMHTDPKYLKQAKDLGACGYIPKSSPAGELWGAIDTIVKGGAYFSKLPQVASTNTSDLTDRQTQVLQLISQGRAAKEIAHALHISVRTAEFHRGEIMNRLNLHSTAMLTRYAIEHDIC